jgi:hypothetical protein
MRSENREGEGGGNLRNLCHCAVDHQRFDDLGRSLVSDIIIIQPERRR